ncbi:hypothetical protein [Nitrosospira sp. Is2]|uniref:hypothetical protein n=1 Tax=Nitrosospira sp. Is2 TaxID=3080532 RepID=UPI0029533BA8|nr:hypothetical protein [Nitrosospira sp. Is2]WON75316.1 hypothetical protein R5L00_07530 [Nitrosospira sp. Is2]
MNKEGTSFLVGLLLALAFELSLAGPPALIDPATGKFLGNLGGNQYDANSTSNPYGRYGSEYSADSVNNPYGQYGSRYSNDSPNNPYATNAPAIVAPTVPGLGIQPLPGF